MQNFKHTEQLNAFFPFSARLRKYTKRNIPLLSPANGNWEGVSKKLKRQGLSFATHFTISAFCRKWCKESELNKRVYALLCLKPYGKNNTNRNEVSTLRRLEAYMELAKVPKCCILKCRAPCWTGKKTELEPLIFLLVIKAIIAICGSCGFAISKLQWLVLIPLNFATVEPG